MTTASSGCPSVPETGPDPGVPIGKWVLAMSSNDADPPIPRVLFVCFTYTQQSLKVAEAMAEVLRARGTSTTTG
jgi:hypothetical protein